jgi:hypothetical protein
VLPGPVAAVRARLFGAAPDRPFLNARCRQLLAVVHASPLVEFVTALDGRVTYAFDDPTFFADATYRPAADPAGGLAVTGAVPPPDVTGRMRRAYAVAVVAEGLAELTEAGPKTLLSLPFAAGVRAAAAGTGLAFTFASAATGQAWRVTALGRPSRGAAELAADLAAAGEPTLDGLFGLNPPEPYRTFRNLWFDCPETALALGGLVCALAYRTEEARRGV